jgi:hypothetical protein
MLDEEGGAVDVSSKYASPVYKVEVTAAHAGR